MTLSHSTKDITVSKIKKDFYLITVDKNPIHLEKSEMRELIQLLDNSIL